MLTATPRIIAAHNYSNPATSASVPYLGPPRVRAADAHENLGVCAYGHVGVSTFTGVQNEIMEHKFKSINLLRGWSQNRSVSLSVKCSHSSYIGLLAELYEIGCVNNLECYLTCGNHSIHNMFLQLTSCRLCHCKQLLMITKLAGRSASSLYSLASAVQNQHMAHRIYIDFSKTSILPINIYIDFSPHIFSNPFCGMRMISRISLTGDSDSMLGEARWAPKEDDSLLFDLTTFLDSLRRGGYLPNTGAQASISAPAYHGGCIVIPLPRHSRHLYFMTSYLQTGVSEKCLGLKLSVLSSCPWNSTQKDCWRGTHTFL